MTSIQQILVTLPLNEAQMATVRAAAPQAQYAVKSEAALTEQDVAAPDVILGNIPLALLPYAKSLRWMQLGGAGAEGYRDPGAMPENARLTCASGAYGPAVAEHAFAMLLALMKRLPAYEQNRALERWQDCGEVRDLYGARVLIAGYGDIGHTFAELMRPFDARILAISRHERDKGAADCVYPSLEDMDALLPQTDVLLCCLPGTKATWHALSRERLEKLPSSAIVLNVGRGGAVDLEALCDLLEAGRLWGAGLDVTEPEPLPAGHRLWHMDRAIITPHIAGGFHMPRTLALVARICAENLRRYQADEPLSGLVSTRLGYASSYVRADHKEARA